MLLALAAIDSFFYPTSEPSELGWWGTPLGDVVGWVAVVVGLPAAYVAFSVGPALSDLGVPEEGASFISAAVGAVTGALIWGWSLAVAIQWLRSRRAV